jgi:sulfoxide reductase catalytic subunit YedY
MNVIRRRGWEIPERLATPEPLVFNRRGFLVGGASALALAPRTAVAQRVSDLAELPNPDGRPLSGQAQREICARPGDQR